MTSSDASAGYVPFPTFVDWMPTDFDTTQFDLYSSLFDETRRQASAESLSRALDVAMRYAAVDTNAIEGIYDTDRGFTRTVATQAIAWESAMDARGPHVRLAFNDALEGYRYVLDATTKAVEISEVWIRGLHEVLCASQETYRVLTDQGPEDRPLVKGKYKSTPNSPTLLDGRVHSYASVLDTPPEMYRLVQELRSEPFLAAHAVLQAAYAHYAYVCIHPFADGNGRVARAIASAYLYRSPGVPLVVFADQRNDYYDALELSDAFAYGSFIQFIGARALDAVQIVRLSLQQSAPPVAETLVSLGSIFDWVDGDEEVQAGAARLKALAAAELEKQFQAIRLPQNLSGHANSAYGGGEFAAPTGYTAFGHSSFFYVLAESSWPVKVRVHWTLGVFTSTDHDPARAAFIVSTRSGEGLEVDFREVSPVETELLRLKVSTWIEGVLAAFFAAVKEAADGLSK